MNQLRKFMYGRYGLDQLSRAIMYFALALALIASFTRSRVLVSLAYLAIIYALFRILSKNIQKRQRENFIYIDFAGKTKTRLKNFKLLLVGTKTHKYYRCRNCRQMIRIPRGKGKVSIICPKCRREFISRT